LQWQPADKAVDGQEVFSITLVERDRKWFADHVDDLKSFWVDLMALRKVYVPPPPPSCTINAGMYATKPVARQELTQGSRVRVIETSSEEEVINRRPNRRQVVETSSSDSGSGSGTTGTTLGTSDDDSDDYEELETLKRTLRKALRAIDTWQAKKRR
jgi:hypothetical protein